MEEWRLINFIPDNTRIFVSDKGRLKNIKNGRILNPSLTKKKYLRFYPSVNRVKYSLLVHQVVARVFIPNPECKPQVNHINFIKTDNSVNNLEWVTNEENMKHCTDAGKMKRHHKLNESYSTKLAVFKTNGDFLSIEYSIVRASIRYSVSPACVSVFLHKGRFVNAKSGRKWINRKSAKGYIFSKLESFKICKGN